MQHKNNPRIHGDAASLVRRLPAVDSSNPTLPCSIVRCADSRLLLCWCCLAVADFATCKPLMPVLSLATHTPKTWTLGRTSALCLLCFVAFAGFWLACAAHLLINSHSLKQSRNPPPPPLHTPWTALHRRPAPYAYLCLQTVTDSVPVTGDSRRASFRVITIVLRLQWAQISWLGLSWCPPPIGPSIYQSPAQRQNC